MTTIIKTIRTPEDNKAAQLENEIIRLKKKIAKYETLELKQYNFGLVWLDVPEAFEDDVENKLPILKEVPELTIKNESGKPTHLLIEGDNYHVLTCLNYTHKGKVDIIYIDPPYNTGSDGFKYKDKRVLDKYPDGTDVPTDHPLRHSYWLSFMSKRIELAKEVMKETGTIFISIDDNEVAQLKLLCDSIFGENNVDIMIWHKVEDDSGRLKVTHRFRREHEYVIVCFKNREKVFFRKYLSDRNYKNEYTNPDNDPRGAYKQGIISNTEEKSSHNGKNYYSVTTPGGRVVTRQWRVEEEEFNKLNADNRIYYGKDGNSIPSIKVFISEQKETTPTSILTGVGTAKTAGIELEELMGTKIFNYPKPVQLIKRLLQISTERDAIVMDFFAGSGTTGQAIMELNKEDGGERQFILVTNNDETTNGQKHKIMTDVCYPRIKEVMGNKVKTGTGDSIKYYKTAFVGKNNILSADDTDKIDLAHNAGEMLAIAENTLEQIEKNDYWQIFEGRERQTAVYFREEYSRLDEFTEKVRKLKKPVTVYIFSWEKELDFNEFEDDKNIKVKTIPQPILEIYKQIYNLI